MTPVAYREAFFGLLKFGLQRYFDRYDKTYSGVISLTIGVSKGKVLGIAKNEGLFESLVVNHKNDNVNDNSHPDRKVNVNVSVNVEQEGGEQ